MSKENKEIKDSNTFAEDADKVFNKLRFGMTTVIPVHMFKILGDMLTIIDSIGLPQAQSKAVKDIVKDRVYQRLDASSEYMNEFLVEAYKWVDETHEYPSVALCSYYKKVGKTGGMKLELEEDENGLPKVSGLVIATGGPKGERLDEYSY